MEHIWRETSLSSLGMAYFALRDLGIAEPDAYKSIELFRDYDEKLLAQQQSIYNDEQKVYETHRNALAELSTYLKVIRSCVKVLSGLTYNVSYNMTNQCDTG